MIAHMLVYFIHSPCGIYSVVIEQICMYYDRIICNACWLSLSCYFGEQPHAAAAAAAATNEQQIMQLAKVIWTFVVYLIWCETRSVNYIWFDKLCICHFPATYIHNCIRTALSTRLQGRQITQCWVNAWLPGRRVVASFVRHSDVSVGRSLNSGENRCCL